MKLRKTSTTENVVGVVQSRIIRLSFWYFLRWLRGPVGIAQGLAQTISFGCWEPSWNLKMEGCLLDYSWEVRDLIQRAQRCSNPSPTATKDLEGGASTVLLASSIAREAHDGQFRRDGITPYITHPETVAKSLEGEHPDVIAAAWLHDVLEDTQTSVIHLKNTGIPWRVIDAVELLTRDDGQPYEDYLHWIAQDEIARKVKIADIRHNLSDAPSEKQIAKYGRALLILGANAYQVRRSGTRIITDEANARMIAAAPDMLEALQNLENDDGSIPVHAWTLCQAAISKAISSANAKDLATAGAGLRIDQQTTSRRCQHPLISLLNFMTLHEKHMHRIALVNRSTTEAEHSTRERDLRNWRAGVEDAGLKLDLCAADWYYLDQGIDRPMCCGVWLDWSEANVEVDHGCKPLISTQC